jgi:hypothetical protein
MFNFDSPFGSTIFCDDIRHEIGNKTSIIGIYSATIYVQEFPANIAKFGIVAYFNEPKRMAQDRKFPIQIQVLLPNEEEHLFSVNLPPLSSEDIANLPTSGLSADPDIPSLITLKAEFILSPLKIEKPGRIKVEVVYGADRIHIGTIAVNAAPIPSPAT